MAKHAPSRAHGTRATGIFDESSAISRRAVLGGLAVAPAIALPLAAPAARESPLIQQMAASRAAANAKFWKLHSEVERLERAWDADPDTSAANWNLHGERYGDAVENALMQGVFCPAAVLAKLKLVRFDADSFALPAPVLTAARIIEWDLERCANERLSNRENIC